MGNLLGGLAGYFQNNRLLKGFGVAAMGVQPIPYYIVAFLFLIFFGFVWPILPISGAYAMNVEPGWNVDFILSVIEHAILPVTSLIVVGFGTWFLGMRALVSNIVTEDYVTYAELAGVPRRRVVGSYVMRNAAVPQLTALALALGSIFSGTIITEQVYTYPGLGTLLVDAVNSGDSTHGARGFHGCRHRGSGRDLHHRSAASPPRSTRTNGLDAMFVVFRDLIRYNREFLIGLVLVIFIVFFSCLSFFSPVDPDTPVRRSARSAALVGVLVRHQFAWAGPLLASHVRDPQHAHLRRCSWRSFHGSSRSPSGWWRVISAAGSIVP